jgi:hypothetical protein
LLKLGLKKTGGAYLLFFIGGELLHEGKHTPLFG